MSTEWSLDKTSFDLLCQRFFVPEVDLFATRENHQVETFVSPVVDSSAVATDAFSLDWNRWNYIYLFPPARMILKALGHLEAFKGLSLIHI